MSKRFAIRDMGTCVETDGTTGFVVDNTTALNWASSFSLTLWYYPMLMGVNQWFASRNATDTGGNWRIRKGTADNIQLYVEQSGGGTFNVSTDNRLKKNHWNTVGIGFNGTEVSVYLNGEIKSGTPTTAPLGGTGLEIGRAYLSQYAKGRFDDVMFYQGTGLTKDQFDGLFFDNIKPTNPTLHWKLDEATGDTAVDSSGNGNDGAIVNAVHSPEVFMIDRPVLG